MEAFDGGANEDTSEPEATSVQSLYTTLGLSSEDVDALAQIPESEISVETLPYLIMQLKAKRSHKASAASDIDYRDKSKTPQDKLDTHESGTNDRRRSPSSSSSARHSVSHGSSHGHDHEHHGKEEGYRGTERSTKSRRDLKYRKPSKEMQSGDDLTGETETGDYPTVFPHVCSLCKCVVNSIKTWKDHLSGVRHKTQESHYSRRSSRPSPPPKRPFSSDSITGDQSMSTASDHLYPPKPNTRVVVAKFPMGTVAVEDLVVLGKPFGTVVKHLVFPAKGFLEFSSHKEAQNMVSHYLLKPAFIKNYAVTLYLSPTVEGIHSPPRCDDPGPKRAKRSNTPCIVCFSHLPPREDIETEILELAGMFGEVRHSKFTDCKALIEMVDWRDADIMVKYYYSNPLRIQGKSIKVTMSHITSLQENSPESPSRKLSSTKSRQKDESSSKTSLNSSNKDKQDSPSQEATKVHKGKKKLEMEEEKMLDDEEGIQMEDEPGLLDEGTDSITVYKKEGEKKREVQKIEEKQPTAAMEEENKREMVSEENLEEQDGSDDADEFPENIEDFVTLDELDNTAMGDSPLDSSKSQDGKVVSLWPVTKKFGLRKALFSLTIPFGNVVNHTISLYRQEALIELESAEKAQAMVRFYKDRKTTLFGRPMSISMCLTMKTIESASGKSIFISSLPRERYTHTSLLKLASRFGKPTGYYLNWNQGTCYIQMDSKEAAQNMILKYSRRPLRFCGSRVNITLCRKGDSLICWKPPDNHERDTEERELKRESKKTKHSTEKTENDQAAKSGIKENPHSSLTDYEGVCGDPVCRDSGSEETGQNQQCESALGPYQPDQVVGVNYIIPVTGFFCKLCNIFYTDENRAKSDHCSSIEHYNSLKHKHDESVEHTDGHPDETDG